MKEQKKSRISKLKVGIATVAVAALLVIPASADEHHTDTDDVQFEIQAGELTVALSDGDLANVAYSNDPSSTTGQITIGVEDARGGDGDWEVSLEADDFVGDDDGQSIPASGLAITGVENLTDASEQNNEDNVAAVDDVTDFSSPQTVGTGTGAHGDFTWDALLQLDIPAGTEANNYSSTLTLTSDEAPD